MAETRKVRPEIITMLKRRLRSGKRLTIAQARAKYGSGAKKPKQ